MTDRTDTLPPLPHPERYYEWTAAEALAIHAWGRRLLAERIAAAVAAEREACAQVCERRAEGEVGMAYEGIALDCAEAIRARGENRNG